MQPVILQRNLTRHNRCLNAVFASGGSALEPAGQGGAGAQVPERDAPAVLPGGLREEVDGQLQERAEERERRE